MQTFWIKDLKTWSVLNVSTCKGSFYLLLAAILHSLIYIQYTASLPLDPSHSASSVSSGSSTSFSLICHPKFHPAQPVNHFHPFILNNPFSTHLTIGRFGVFSINLNVYTLPLFRGSLGFQRSCWTQNHDVTSRSQTRNDSKIRIVRCPS